MDDAPRNTTPYHMTTREAAVSMACKDMEEAVLEFSEGLIERPDYEQRRRNFLLTIEGENYA